MIFKTPEDAEKEFRAAKREAVRKRMRSLDTHVETAQEGAKKLTSIVCAANASEAVCSARQQDSERGPAPKVKEIDL